MSKLRLGQQRQGKSTTQFKRSVWTAEKESRAPSPPPAATALPGGALASKGAAVQLQSGAQLQALRSPRDPGERSAEAEEVEVEEEEAAAAAAAAAAVGEEEEEEEETKAIALGRPQWQLQVAAEGGA